MYNVQLAIGKIYILMTFIVESAEQRSVNKMVKQSKLCKFMFLFITISNIHI